MPLDLSDLSDLAQVFIALVNLFLVSYVFVYQRAKDKEDKLNQIKLQDQNIHLQWFKELIIQPHLNDIYQFYKDIHDIEHKLKINPLGEDEKIEIVNYIKKEQVELRKSFMDAIRNIDQKLYDDIKENLDLLTDKLTETIINKDLDFSDKSIYDSEIKSIITYSRNDLISKIFNYKGIH